jgi:hypothetical protein
MTNDSQPIVKPQDRFTVVVNGQDQEVFMSGGLLRKLVPVAGVLSDFSDVYTNTEIQNELLVTALMPRNVRGSTVGTYSIDDFEMTVEEFDKLLGWIMEHILHFFIGSVTNAQQMVEKNQPAMAKLERLMQSMTGSPDSQLKKESAGDSTAS